MLFFRYVKYQESILCAASSDTVPISSFLAADTGIDHYPSGHSRQRLLTESIVEDLIIYCSLPLSIVENPGFRRFLKKADPKYVPTSRTTVVSKLSHMTASTQESMKTQLAGLETVSVTVDIWSDRKMRGYLGVTVHFLEVTEHAIKPRSQLMGL